MERCPSSIQMRLRRLAEIAECDLDDMTEVLAAISAATTLAVAKRLAAAALRRVDG
jgi:hypothetical protein